MGTLRQYATSQIQGVMKTSSIPENWHQLRTLVQNDTVMSSDAKGRIISLTADLSHPDVVEKKLSSLKEYRYLRERLYPQLRSVSFDFYLHRRGMVKDTIHTTCVDTVYMKGLDAMRDMDYARAVEILRPYADYNSALAFASSGFNHSALKVLERLNSSDPKVCYLMALVLSRLDRDERAQKYFEQAIEIAPSLEFRANLDPEMSRLVRRRSQNYDKF